jgi:hypothetical protein
MDKVSELLDVHSLKKVKLKALWVLDHRSTEGNDRFTISEIVKYLVEICGVNTSWQAVWSALKQAGSMVHKNNNGFKIMKSGIDRLKEELPCDNTVVFIESGKPFSATHIKLSEILANLSGEVLVCDPYFDVKTIDLIFSNFNKATPIRLLTQDVKDKPSGTLSRELVDLRKEGFQIEVRIYSGSELHDRYIMDGNSFWLSGNSLNGLGNKESFIVRLGDDVRQGMTAVFNNRWKTSNPI